MPNCDMCGKSGANTNAIVEGTMMSVCKSCSKFGKVIEIKKPIIVEQPRETYQERFSQQQDDPEVTIDYGNQIRLAREKLNLKQSELANNIGEKESVISKLESNKLMPSEIIAKKLEQYLKITLHEYENNVDKENLNLKDRKLTIGDLKKIKDDKKTASH